MAESKSCWTEVTEMMETPDVSLGRYMAYWFNRTPRRALYCMSYYKFAAKMIGKNKRVLDVGCSEGLGTWVLAKECGFARGIDSDEAAIEVGKQNWDDPRIDFSCEDFLTATPEPYDAVTNFDVIEHILPQNAGAFVGRIAENLKHDGIAVIGTPNIVAQVYASEVSKAGHVNCYSGERLEAEMREHFHHVFMFVANDEVVHTGFQPTANYLLAVGCRKK
ncbi:MAG: methyltransferase domain-containing protein [Planctomycetales bacterium]|nr:methyltransferase domain-containing protein [Planctomycetales bacterium]MBN8624466.1 methyltransferase domain-containing protein [Planctomycetota bacterium]